MDYYHGDIPVYDPETPDGRDALFTHDGTYSLRARNFDVDPPEMLADPQGGIQLTDPSEDDARWEEQEKHENSLEHIFLRGGKPAFVNLDQGRDGDCHTADTEVLTERGFVAWPDYNWSDLLGTVNPATHRLEFQAPFEKHVKDYNGPVVYGTNRRLNFAVTPGHGMYVRKWDERKRTLTDRYDFVKADDLGWYAGMLHAPSGWAGTEMVELEVPGDRRYDGDDLIALLGLIVSDGYAGGTENTKNQVSFASFREDIRPRVSALAARTGFRPVPSRPGVWNRYGSGAFAEWVRANCYTGGLGSRCKKVPDIVKIASERQIKLFLHWFDDRNRSGRQFYSTSKRMVDDLQELHLRIGKRSTINEHTAKPHGWNGKTFRESHGYVLTVGEVDQLSIERKYHIEREHYRGPVYCAGVPNHTLVTRRNGTVLISSNCWAYSTGHAYMLCRLRDNLDGADPVLRVNPHFIAAHQKRYNGGWCGLSGKVIADVGILPEGNGPGEWQKWSHRNPTAADLEAAAKFRTDEMWMDLTRPVYGQVMTERARFACGFNNIPCPSDYMFMSHSVCFLRKVRIERGSWGDLILNSWLGWGRHGLGVLRGSQARADNAIAVRTVRPSKKPT